MLRKRRLQLPYMPLFGECEADCGNKAPALAAVRMEELLKSNGWLKKQLDELELELIAQEALLAENAELQEKVELLVENGCTMRKEIQKLVFEKSGLELEIGRLEAERDHFRDLTKKLWCEKQYGEDTNVPTKWISVEEKLPDSADHSVLAVVYGHYENMDEHCAIHFHNALEIATYYRDDGKWFVEAYPYWENPEVTYWQPLPEPPSTEGVE